MKKRVITHPGTVAVRNKITGEVSTAVSAGASRRSPNKKHSPESPPLSQLDKAPPRPSATAKPANADKDSAKTAVAQEAPATVDKVDAQTDKEQITNLAQFLSYAFDRKGQRLVLTPQVQAVIGQDPEMDPETLAGLLARGRLESQKRMAVPRQLLLCAREVTGFPALKSALRNFVGHILSAHWIFSTPALAAALKNLPDAPDTPHALSMVADVPAPTDSATSDNPQKLTKKGLSDLRTNAIYCLALWLVDTRNLSVETLNRHLFTALWQPAASSVHDDTTRLRFLTEIRDLPGTGLAVAQFQRRALDGLMRADAAIQQQETLKEQLLSFKEDNQRMQQQIAEREARIAALEQALAQERTDHRHTRVHLRDDLERMRRRFLHQLKSEAGLLAEGLQALRRSPPKTSVMEDHAERVLEGMNREIKKLEQEH